MKRRIDGVVRTEVSAGLVGELLDQANAGRVDLDVGRGERVHVDEGVDVERAASTRSSEACLLAQKPDRRGLGHDRRMLGDDRGFRSGGRGKPRRGQR